jgi:hypothetical protein
MATGIVAVSANHLGPRSHNPQYSDKLTLFHLFLLCYPCPLSLLCLLLFILFQNLLLALVFLLP